MCAKKVIFGILLNVFVKMVNIQVVILTTQLYVIKLQKQKILAKLFQKEVFQQILTKNYQSIKLKIYIFYLPFY